MKTENETRITPKEFIAEISADDGWRIAEGGFGREFTRHISSEHWPVVTNAYSVTENLIRVCSGRHVVWDVPNDDIVMPNEWTILIREPFVRREQRKLSEGGGFRNVDDIRVALKLENPSIHERILEERRIGHMLEVERKKAMREKAETVRAQELQKHLQGFVGKTIHEITTRNGGETVLILLAGGKSITFSWELNDCEGGYCVAGASVNEHSIRFDG